MDSQKTKTLICAILAFRVADFAFGTQPDDEIHWVLSYAFATRRAVSIEVAKEILRKSVAKFPKEAAVFFNLACYECQLGEIENAKKYLKKAFAFG